LQGSEYQPAEMTRRPFVLLACIDNRRIDPIWSVAGQTVQTLEVPMNISRFQPQSLKARLTLLMLLMVVAGFLLLANFIKSMMRDELLRFTGEQQRSALAVLVSHVELGLKERMTMLSTVAKRITPSDLADPMAGQAFLLERPFLANVFNGGVVLWNRDGQSLTDLEFNGLGAVKQPLATQELSQLLHEGQPLVGRVHRDAQLQVGVFAIAVPVRNPQGQIIGALGGVIRLDQPNFLTPLIDHPYGKAGHFFLIDAQTRLIFATSDHARVLELLPEPGQHPMIDKFVAGFDGTELAVNPHGVDVLVSVKPIPAARWYASVTLPPQEVFALITALQPRSRVAYVVFLCLVALGVGWMVRRQLAPMTDAVQTLRGFVYQNKPPQALPVARPDEVGELVTGFNQLLETLAQQQSVLQHSETFKLAILNSVTAKLAVLNAQGVIVAVNEAWQQTHGTPRATEAALVAAVGTDYLAVGGEASHHTVSDDGRSAAEGIRAVLAGLIPRYYLEYPQHTLTQTHWCSMSVTPLAQGADGGAVVSLEDITERVVALQQIRELAFNDPLTGLPNRRLVSDRLSQEMARATRAQSRLALLFIDLDKFKPINDILGHATGDWLLQAVAKRLQQCLRTTDTAGRLGGDEFIALLPGLIEVDDALAIAEKIRHALAQEFFTEQGLSLQISCSVGVAIFPDHGQTEIALLRLGDEAMYRAKESGRNAVVLCVAPSHASAAPDHSATAHIVAHLRWRSAFCCGHASNDLEHEALFNLANGLIDSAREPRPEAFEAAFTELLAHTATHFEHEEALLSTVPAAAFAEHAALHQDLLARARELYEQLRVAPQEPGAQQALLEFLVQDVVAKHILQDDRGIFATLADLNTADRSLGG
jgi:diguanylate cyclase (GGDEF)-like protein/hemerythrin-like metal-binding protein